MNPRKAENVFSERKRDNGVNTWLGKVKMPFESENVALKGEKASAERNRHTRRRKCVYRTKTSHIRDTERRLREHRRIRILRTKTWFPKLETRFSSEYVPRKIKISP